LVEVLGRVTMQVLVHEHCTMIAAPVQCDVYGIPKGSHYARVPRMGSLAMRAVDPAKTPASAVSGAHTASPAAGPHYAPPLQTGMNDARSVQSVLQARYGFETTLLLNATRSQMFRR